MSLRLLLVPHAPTQWNAERRYQGHVDTPLSAVGRRQARWLAERLAGETIDQIHASDLRRAVETAEAIAELVPLPLHLEPRLRELRFGAWEGLTFDEVCQKFPDVNLTLETNVPRIAPAGGETLAELAARIGSYFAELQANVPRAQTILVVAHRGALQVFLCLALGLPPDSWWKFRLEPASITELNVFASGTVLHSFNATDHLRGTLHAR